MRVGAAFVIVFALGWALMGSGGPSILAQEATPEAMALPEGVSLEFVAAGTAETLPPAPATLAIIRSAFEPGASFQIPADDPDTGLFVVESGVLTVRSTVPVTVSRAGDLADMEQIAAETEFMLDQGDSFVSPPNSGAEFRNDSSETVVLLVAAIEVAVAGEMG